MLMNIWITKYDYDKWQRLQQLGFQMQRLVTVISYCQVSNYKM